MAATGWQVYVPWSKAEDPRAQGPERLRSGILLPIGQTLRSFGLRERYAGRLDLIPEPGIGGRLDLEPMIVGGLPGADRFGQVVQNQVALCRYGYENDMASSCSRLDHRQP